ncbi:MAG: transporter [Candidatus Omnitrophica bacterium]|nr:transporter [Candidatus Omnitrophota bacterium]
MLARVIIFALAVLCVYPAAYAANLGHYSPDSNGVRDYLMSSKKGFSLFAYNKYYASDGFRGPGGSKFDSLSALGTATKYINIGNKSTPVTIDGDGSANFDFSLDNFMQTFDLTWVPNVKFLGADYALVISPSWGYARFKAKAQASSACAISVGNVTKSLSAGGSTDFMEQNTGFGDLYVQPLWFAWRGQHYDIGLSYGFYSPTGYYDKDSIANIGFGFWTQQVQANLFYFPSASHSTAFVIRPTYEWNSRKIDEDVQPGQTITFEYGVSHYVHPRAEIALLGYNQLQLTGERGSAATNKKALSYTAGVGALINWWIVENKCSLTAKFNAEYATKFNFRGDAWSLNAVWVF